MIHVDMMWKRRIEFRENLVHAQSSDTRLSEGSSDCARKYNRRVCIVTYSVHKCFPDVIEQESMLIATASIPKLFKVFLTACIVVEGSLLGLLNKYTMLN